MTNDKMTQLGMQLFGEKVADVDSAMEQLDGIVTLTNNHREILKSFGGAVTFENGARYRPQEKPPLTTPDGYNSLDLLYGIGDGRFSIRKTIFVYEDNLPPLLVPIGEPPGGNLICVDTSGIVYFWDHESARGGKEVWQIASSVDEFFERLEPDDIDVGNLDGIIESESFLDF